MLLTIFPSKRSSKISFQTSPEIRHQFRQKLRQLHSGNRRYLHLMGERQSIAQNGVRAIDARNSQLENRSNAAKPSVRAPGLSTDEREHPFV